MNKMFDFIKKNSQGSEKSSEPEVVDDMSFLQEDNDLNLDAMLENDEDLSLEKWGIEDNKADESNVFEEGEVENSNAWLESGNTEVGEEETTSSASWLNDEENAVKELDFSDEDDFPVKKHSFETPVFEQDMSLDFLKPEKSEQNDSDGMDIFGDDIESLADAEEVAELVPETEEFDKPLWLENEAANIEEIVEDANESELESLTEMEEVAELVPETEEFDKPLWLENETVYTEEITEEKIAEPKLLSAIEPEIEEYRTEEYIAPHPEKVLEANLGYINWYSGNLSDEYFEVSRTANSETIYGYQGKDTIHVNVGADTYGWNVEFTSGLKMSLRDVKIYQLRQGCLPAEQGVITYGNLRIEFVAIKRITVYETVEYFSY